MKKDSHDIETAMAVLLTRKQIRYVRFMTSCGSERREAVRALINTGIGLDLIDQDAARDVRRVAICHFPPDIK